MNIYLKQIFIYEYLLTAERKDYDFMIDGRNFSDQPIKNGLRTYDNIRKTVTVQGDDNFTGRFQNYPYFKNYYKIIATDLSKQQNLDADPKAIKQMNFTGNLSRAEKMRQCFSLLKKQKKQEQLSIMILFRFNKMLA